MIDRTWLYELLTGIAADRSPDFVGLGVIVYAKLDNLPIVRLGSARDTPNALPIVGKSEVSLALSVLATRQSGHHDGFHLIEAASGDLTHVAQFVSPPLSAALAKPDADWPRGARQMTALLVSTLAQVDMAAIVTISGDIMLYKDGRLATAEQQA